MVFASFSTSATSIFSNFLLTPISVFGDKSLTMRNDRCPFCPLGLKGATASIPHRVEPSRTHDSSSQSCSSFGRRRNSSAFRFCSSTFESCSQQGTITWNARFPSPCISFTSNTN
ncbi:unnamed protein product [Haemonchus placei]|uniref:Uncharacterized protein n=1 Tax=Haemonchus placei TaxID=6290 RepID=A0A3P8A0S3_HAEPC|nr:unnamed protein product [Haemonchus placei]